MIHYLLFVIDFYYKIHLDKSLVKFLLKLTKEKFQKLADNND